MSERGRGDVLFPVAHPGPWSTRERARSAVGSLARSSRTPMGHARVSRPAWHGRGAPGMSAGGLGHAQSTEELLIGSSFLLSDRRALRRRQKSILAERTRPGNPFPSAGPGSSEPCPLFPTTSPPPPNGPLIRVAGRPPSAFTSNFKTCSFGNTRSLETAPRLSRIHRVAGARRKVSGRFVVVTRNEMKKKNARVYGATQ